MKCVSFYFSVLLLTLFEAVLNTCEPEWFKQTKNESYSLRSSFYESTDAKKCSCLNNNTTENNFCVRKCCQKNYILSDYTCIYDKNNAFTKYPIPLYINQENAIERNLNEINILSGMIACKGNKSLRYSLVKITDIFPGKAGIRKERELFWVTEENLYYSHDHYCIDYSEEDKVSAFVCELDYIEDFNFGDRLSFVGRYAQIKSYC